MRITEPRSWITMYRLSLAAIFTIILVLNFMPLLADERGSFEMSVNNAYEIILGTVTQIEPDINGARHTIQAEKVLKRGRAPGQKIWAHCHALDVLPEHQCPNQDQSSIIFIIESGQDNYYVTQVQPAEKEAEITSLLKEQDRIMREGSKEEVNLQKFIDSFCTILEKNDFEGFKNITLGLEIDEQLVDDKAMQKAFEDLKNIHKEYNYRKVYLKNFKQERYPIYKGIYTLGGHEYGYTYIHFQRKDNSWVITNITHCD